MIISLEKKKRFKFIFLSLLCFFLTLIFILTPLYLVFFPQKKEIFFERLTDGFIRMKAHKIGTLLSVTIDCENEERAGKIFSLILSEVEKIDRLFSEFRKDSILSMLNKKADKEEIIVPDEVFYLIKTSLYFSDISDGRWDITFKPLWDLYNEKGAPSQNEINKTKELVNYRYIKLDEKRKSVKFEKKGVKISLGGIAKGFVLKKIAEILKKEGINNFLIDAGGDIFGSGKRNGRLWRVAIQNPVKKRGEEIAYIELENSSIATSGGYERFVFVQGKKIHHIIDPFTGESPSDFLSVSIVGKDPVITDVLATAVFLLGREGGYDFIKRFEGYDAFIIDKNAKVMTTNSNIFKLKELGNY